MTRSPRTCGLYTAINADQAMLAFERFEAKWPELQIIGRMWREAWPHVIPFLAFEPEVRRVIYTTNAIEALNRQLRKAIKTKGSFPSEEAAIKLIYLAIQNAVPQWTRTGGGRKRCSHSRSNSETASPTNHQPPPTQKSGRPRLVAKWSSG
jgi:transposase-like protein